MKLVLALEFVAVALTVLLERLLAQRPGTGFGEHGPITILSVLQLLAIGFLSLSIHATRLRERQERWSWRSPTVVWAIMGFGFLFMAADERLQFHERMDHGIHGLFGMQETPLTDRIDDLIIGGYALIGALVVHRFRGELALHRQALPLLVAGFAFVGVTFVLDLATHGAHLPWLSGLAEEGAKVVAEGLFLVAAYDCRRRVGA